MGAVKYQTQIEETNRQSCIHAHSPLAQVINWHTVRGTYYPGWRPIRSINAVRGLNAPGETGQ